MATRSMTYDAPGTVFTVHKMHANGIANSHDYWQGKTGYVADVNFAFLRQPDQETSEEFETVARDDFHLLKHSLGKPWEGSFL